MQRAVTLYLIDPPSDLAPRLERFAREGGARLLRFEDIADARAALSRVPPDVLIAHWRNIDGDSGDSALSLHRRARAEAAGAPGPYMLLLAGRITAARIALASRAGRAELIPAAPLDARALENRLTLLLWGAEALRDRIWGYEEAEAMRKRAFERMPALRRRFDAA